MRRTKGGEGEARDEQVTECFRVFGHILSLKQARLHLLRPGPGAVSGGQDRPDRPRCPGGRPAEGGGRPAGEAAPAGEEGSVDGQSHRPRLGQKFPNNAVFATIIENMWV